MKRATTALMVMVLMGAAFSEETKKPSVAQVCGIDTARASDGVFAKDKQWKRYASVKEVPRVEQEELAQVWRAEQGSFVQIAAKSSGFARYYEYCFDKSGKLARLNYEVRSPYGWGFARTNVMKDGQLTPVTQRFFGLKSNRTIPKPPEEARDAQWALYPKAYKSFDKLPFAKMIAERKTENAQAH